MTECVCVNIIVLRTKITPKLRNDGQANQVKKAKRVEIIFYTENVWNMTHNCERYNIIQRDLNSITCSVLKHIRKNGIQLVDTDVLDFAVIDDSYMEFLRQKQKEHSQIMIEKYIKSLNQKSRLELWKKNNLDVSFNHFFFPVYIKGFQKGKEYSRLISEETQKNLQKICCQTLEIPMEDLFVSKQMFTIEEIIKEKSYLTSLAEANMDGNGLFTKRALDTYVAHGIDDILFIPIVERVYFPNNMFEIKSYKEYFFGPISMDETNRHMYQICLKEFFENEMMVIYPELSYSLHISKKTERRRFFKKTIIQEQDTLFSPMNIVEAIDYYNSFFGESLYELG